MRHPRSEATRAGRPATSTPWAVARWLTAMPLALALAGTAAPVAAASLGTETLTVEATVEQVVVDGPEESGHEEGGHEEGGAGDELVLDTHVSVDGTLYDVPDDVVAAADPTGEPVRTGDAVEVTVRTDGDLTGTEALAAAEDPTDPDAEVLAITVDPTAAALTSSGTTTSTAVLGAHTLVVLPVHWGTPTSQSRYTLTDVASRASRYWAEQSGNRLTLTTTVRDWARIPEPIGCPTSTMMRDALAAHGEAASSRTRHVAVVFPERADCGGWAGKGSILGGNIWVNGIVTEDILAHELGHNLGIGHADTATCTDGGARVALSGACTSQPYADLADVMGYATTQASGSLNTALADWLGLVDVVEVDTLPATVELARLSDVTAPRAIRLTTGHGTVYLNYRPAVGRDVRQPAWAGLQAHRLVGGSYPGSQLLDLRPTTSRPFSTPSLAVAGSWDIPGAGVTVTLTGTTTDRATVTLTSTAAPYPPPPAPGPVALGADLTFVPITPTRLLDTRESSSALGAGGRRDVVVAGTRGIPADARAVALNLTAVGATTATHLRAWPTGAAMPGSSVLNTDPSRAVASGVMLGVGAGGSVSVYNAAGAVHVLADVTGYYVASGGSGFEALPAAVRVLDTRGAGTGTGPVASGGTRTIQIAGRHGVPADATAAVVNVTTVTSGDGYAVAYPAGSTPPLASTVNHLRGSAAANRATVRLGSGSLSVAVAGAPAHVIVDVVGWYGPSGKGLFTPVTPDRAFDTRLSGPAFSGGESRGLDVRAAGVPAEARTAVMVLTATGGTAYDSYLTAWGSGTRPATSDLNIRSGRDQANLALVPVATGGSVRVYNNLGSVHVIGDVLGYFS